MYNFFKLTSVKNFEAFTAAMFQIEVFWIVTPCSVMVRYRRFGAAMLPPSSGWSRWRWR